MKMNMQTVAILCLFPVVLVACSPQSDAARTPGNTISLAEAPSLVPAPAPAVPLAYMEGKRVFDKTCGLCHGAGVAGAPRPGDKAAWAHRLAQGDAVLYQHALMGFEGATGYMPPRGGGKLTDAEVKAGVDYMVAMTR